MRDPIIRLAPRRATGQHPGLLLTRYLAEQNDEGRDKRALLAAACGASRAPSLLAVYQRAFERWREGLGRIKAEADMRTPAHTRLILGLGNKGVVEAGLRLHHTYGVPLIPGSALKGLTSHYCHEVYGPSDEQFRRDREYHNLLFGKTDDSGVIRFEDGWIHPDSLGPLDQGLLADVMTPHHQEWQTEETVAPTDFDSPIPVPFLSVAGCFHIVVVWQGPDHPQAQNWTTLGFRLLQAALSEWGIGGKTSSGYGRLTDVKEAAGSPSPATTRSRSLPPGAVLVTVLAKHEAGGRTGFWVQEEGKPKGLLMYGKPPLELPDVDTQIVVYRNNNDLRNPQYRWDRPSDQPPPGRPSRGPQRPSR